MHEIVDDNGHRSGLAQQCCRSAASDTDDRHTLSDKIWVGAAGTAGGQPCVVGVCKRALFLRVVEVERSVLKPGHT